MRTTAIAALSIAASLLVPHISMAADGDTKYRHAGCHSHACDKRVTKRHKIHKRYRFCNTWACVKRVDKKRAARMERHMRRTIAPYRGWLDSTGDCETRGYSRSASYGVNTGNGFYGRYQFDLSSWQAAGGVGYPHNAPALEQDYRAVVWLKKAGRGAWPVCG